MARCTTSTTQKKKQAGTKIAKQQKAPKMTKEEASKLEDFRLDLEIDAHYGVIKRWQEDEFAELRKVIFKHVSYAEGIATYSPLCPSVDEHFKGFVAKAKTESRLFKRDPMFAEFEDCIAKKGTMVSADTFYRDYSNGTFAVGFDRVFILAFTYFYNRNDSVKQSIAKTKRLIESKQFYLAEEEDLIKNLYEKSLKKS